MTVHHIYYPVCSSAFPRGFLLFLDFSACVIFCLYHLIPSTYSPVYPFLRRVPIALDQVCYFQIAFFPRFFSTLFSISITTHPPSYCTSSHHKTRPDRLGSRPRCTNRNSCFAPEVLFSMPPRAKRVKCKVRFAVDSCGLGFKLT